MRIPLFVKKSNAEGNDFYYLGNMSIITDSAIEKMIVKDDWDNVSVVEMNFTLLSPVEKSLYDYLLNSN
jgi:Mg2+/citrate symporter